MPTAHAQVRIQACMCVSKDEHTYVFLNLCRVTPLNVVLHECSYALLIAVLS